MVAQHGSFQNKTKGDDFWVAAPLLRYTRSAPGRLFFMERYSKVLEKRQRELVLLRGRGCAFPACSFCDYHDDKCSDDQANFQLNKSVLDRVDGQFGDIEIINSGSVFELDEQTRAYIRQVCTRTGIHTIHFEAHYKFRDRIAALREEFAGFDLKMKIGVETFDAAFREQVLTKGIAETDPAVIAKGFQEANFLFGITGQTRESMERDIALGLEHFERICINIMTENTTAIKPDPQIIATFVNEVMPQVADNWRVDILLNNTDFGVGD